MADEAYRSILSHRLASILVTLGVVCWLQEIFSIEWSSAYCSDPVDGPASAVWGMPLPYIRWSTVSSMEYFWMPAVFVLNIALLFAVAYPLISWLVSAARTSVGTPVSDRLPQNTVDHLQGRRSRALVTMLTFGGALLVLTFTAWIGLQIYMGVYRIPVSNIANENYESYTDLRPVGFGFKSLRYNCTPLK
jgi:hypothetical protein